MIDGRLGTPFRSVLPLLIPGTRTARARRRLRHPEGAAVLAGLVDRAHLVLLAPAAAAAVSALVPGPPGQAPRLYPLGMAAGFLSGIPWILDRRALRRRLASAPAAAGSPPAPVAGDPRALAAVGDVAGARRAALGALRADPPRLGVAAGTGLMLCRAGRFRDGIELLERAAELAGDARRARRREGGADTETPGERQARLALVEGLRLHGRLREAVIALDGGPGPLTPAGRQARGV